MLIHYIDPDTKKHYKRGWPSSSETPRKGDRICIDGHEFKVDEVVWEVDGLTHLHLVQPQINEASHGYKGRVRAAVKEYLSSVGTATPALLLGSREKTLLDVVAPDWQEMVVESDGD